MKKLIAVNVKGFNSPCPIQFSTKIFYSQFNMITRFNMIISHFEKNNYDT